MSNCYECDTPLTTICPQCNALSAAPSPDGEEVERVALAIDEAGCPDREGPFGGYDYGHNRTPPEGGRYVVRDFRDPASPDYGAWIHQTDDRELHDATLERMTRHHIARAAILAMRPAPKLTEEDRARVEAIRRWHTSNLARFENWHHDAGDGEVAFDFLEDALSLIDKITEAG